MAYPIKAICEAKDKRSDGTSIIYLQYCYTAGKRTNLNTCFAIPPKYWNKKQSIISDMLTADYGVAGLINDDITRQLRLAEDLIKWAIDNKKTPIGDYVKQTFRPDLSIAELKSGINFMQFNLLLLVKGTAYCFQPVYPITPIPTKALIIPYVKKVADNPMIFPGVPIDSPLNGRPWPNVFEELESYMLDKKGDVSPKTIQVYKNVGDHLRQYEGYRKQPITFLSFDFEVVLKGMKRNSISKTIKQLRFFVKDRVKRKIIPPIDMSDFKAPEEETDATYLNFAEISRFYDTDLSAYPYLIGDQKLFVLACLTGLRLPKPNVIGLPPIRAGDPSARMNF